LGVSASLIATIAVGVTSVITTIIGIILLGYIGRRTMLLIGFSGVATAQAALRSRSCWRSPRRVATSSSRA
jgi:major inositol transporter-like SP family MFS transporter